MTAFVVAYEAWRERPFPHGSSNDAIDELHADIVLADTWVANSVIPYVEEGIYEPADPDVLAELSRLRERADRLSGVGSAEDAQILLAYREYVDILSEIYSSYLAKGGEG